MHNVSQLVIRAEQLRNTTPKVLSLNERVENSRKDLREYIILKLSSARGKLSECIMTQTESNYEAGLATIDRAAYVHAQMQKWLHVLQTGPIIIEPIVYRKEDI